MPGTFYPECRVYLQVVFERFGLVQRPTVFPVQALEVSVFVNSYREADTFSVTFDAKDFPFSPELVRAAAVEVYLFNKRSLGDRPVAVSKGLDDQLFLDGAPLQPSIAGLVDNAEMEWGEDGRTFSVDGRDYTALFLDKQWDPAKRVPVGKRLDAALSDLVAQVPGAKGNTPGGGSLVTVRVDPPELALRLPVVGVSDGRSSRRGIQFPKGSNYWEVMQALALRYGFILFVRGLDVVLTTPKTFVAGRTSYRKMAWGRNISALAMRRKIGKERVPVVEVTAWDDKAMKLLRERFPERRDKVVDTIALGVERDEVKQFALTYPVRSRAVLRQIAESVFYQLARAELTVNVETSDLADLEGTDLVELRAGDPVGLKFDPFNESTFREFTTEGEKLGYLLALGYSEQVAAAVAQNFEHLAQVREPLRLREGSIDWSHDGGMTINMELVQFVDVSKHGAVP